jgi:hypothetical protein
MFKVGVYSVFVAANSFYKSYKSFILQQIYLHEKHSVLFFRFAYATCVVRGQKRCYLHSFLIDLT